MATEGLRDESVSNVEARIKQSGVTENSSTRGTVAPTDTIDACPRVTRARKRQPVLRKALLTAQNTFPRGKIARNE